MGERGWSGVTGVERPIKRHFKPPPPSEGSFDAPTRAATVLHRCFLGFLWIGPALA